MILKKKLEEILKEFYDSDPKDFKANTGKFADDIIKLFVDSINRSEVKRDNQLCG